MLILLSNKVLSSFNEQGNEKAILKVLTYIHDEWVKNNGKKVIEVFNRSNHDKTSKEFANFDDDIIGGNF